MASSRAKARVGRSHRLSGRAGITLSGRRRGQLLRAGSGTVRVRVLLRRRLRSQPKSRSNDLMVNLPRHITVQGQRNAASAPPLYTGLPHSVQNRLSGDKRAPQAAHVLDGLVIIEALAAGWTKRAPRRTVHYMTDNEGPQTTRLQQNRRRFQATRSEPG